MTCSGVVASFQSYLTNPKDPCAVFLQKSKAIDKILKLSDPILDVAGEIAGAYEAPQDTLDGIKAGRSWAKGGRDALGMFNIFSGVIAGLYCHLATFWTLLTEMKTNHVVYLKPNPKKYNDVAQGTTEKFLAAGSRFGSITGSLTYILGFGVSRPIANIEKYCKVELGETAQKIGASFSLIMMVNHIGGLIGSLFEMGFQHKAFNNLPPNYQPVASFNEYIAKMWLTSITFIQKTLNLINDFVNILAKSAPATFRIPLCLLIATFELYEVWLKTD